MQQINTNNTSIIHVNSLLWLFFGRRKSPSPTLHDEITNHARICFVGPPDFGHQGGATVSHQLSLVSGVPKFRFSWFFLGPKKASGFSFSRIFHPSTEGSFGVVMSFDLQMHLKGMYLEEIHNLYMPIAHMFGWYIKYAYIASIYMFG